MKVDFIPETEPKPAAAIFLFRIGAKLIVAVLLEKYNKMIDSLVEPERYPAKRPGYVEDPDEDSDEYYDEYSDEDSE